MVDSQVLENGLVTAIQLRATFVASPYQSEKAQLLSVFGGSLPAMAIASQRAHLRGMPALRHTDPELEP